MGFYGFYRFLWAFIGFLNKVSFDEAQLIENIRSFVDAVAKARPIGSKGAYMKKIAVSSTMGPSVTINVDSATGD